MQTSAGLTARGGRSSGYKVTVHRPPDTALISPTSADVLPRFEFKTPKQKTTYNRTSTSLSNAQLTPQDQNRLHFLCSDPSVASFVRMYDEHGSLDSQLFANTPPSPPKPSRVQTQKPNGLTLRQLLGSPVTLSGRDYGRTRSTSATDSDISWAEKYLE